MNEAQNGYKMIENFLGVKYSTFFAYTLTVNWQIQQGIRQEKLLGVVWLVQELLVDTSVGANLPHKCFNEGILVQELCVKKLFTTTLYG